MAAGGIRRGVLRSPLVVVGLAGLMMLGAGAASAIAADPPDPGKTETFTYDSGGTAYPYIVYTPTTYHAARPAPLLVMTHGCQTTAEQQMRANLYNPIAEREGIVMLYPDVNAMEAAQPGPTARCWQFPDPNSWHRDSGDAAAIAGMTRAVMERWRIDPERVYMMGMSAGSFMTSIMAAAYPDLYAAVGIMAGGAYADGGCLFGAPGIPVEVSAQLAYNEMGPRARVVPRLVMGGDADQGVSPACADKALEQGLRTNNLVLSGTQDRPISLTPSSTREVTKPGGYSTTIKTYRDPHGCIIGERWLIHGMNHFWSGGTSDPKYKDFTDPKGPSGADASWGFFRRYTKSARTMPCAEAPAASPSSPAPVAARCRARWLRLRLPRGTTAVRANVNGRRAAVRVARRHVRIRLPATRRARTTLVVRGRTSTGKHITRRYSYHGCGR
ncbi:MAG TPA: PHB depolymerase family esterase [Solirubrobacteraceae bacterium]|jgi:poly(hydroxyalkanoate) depolymerase family esterase|nr:PHB depolymerase family esterase [Solirubrobacteraceae bacterium]